MLSLGHQACPAAGKLSPLKAVEERPARPGKHEDVESVGFLAGTRGRCRVRPLVAINMWEHAYLLDYGVDRDAYIDASWRQINWNRVALLLGLH